MTADELRAACLALPGAREEQPFSRAPDLSTFKVGGKVFALSRLGRAGPLSVSLKCEPVLAEGLRAAHAAIAPGYHLDKRHWNTVTLDGTLPDGMVADMIEDSYDLVLAKLPKARRPGPAEPHAPTK
jgi:predicted DNA-binding protein (MmcQ/YjbR family)